MPHFPISIGRPPGSALDLLGKGGGLTAPPSQDPQLLGKWPTVTTVIAYRAFGKTAIPKNVMNIANLDLNSHEKVINSVTVNIVARKKTYKDNVSFQFKTWVLKLVWLVVNK